MRILIAVVVALLASPAAALAQEITVRVASTTGAPMMTLFAAEDQGFYKDEGLKVEWTMFASTAGTTGALVSNNVDLAQTTVLNSVQAFGAGAPIRLLAALEYSFIDRTGRAWEDVFLAVRESESINRLEDLRGKTIAVNDRGGAYEWGLRKNLKQRGMDADRDVSIVAIPFPQMAGALAQKQIDAAIMTAVAYGVLNETVKLKPLLRRAELQGLAMDQSAAFGGGVRYLREHPDRVVRFLKALLRANQFLAKDRVEQNGATIREIGKRRLKYTDRLAQHHYQYRAYYGLEHDFVGPQQLVRNSIPFYADVLRDLGFLKRDVAYEDIVDESFLRKAYAELGLRWREQK